MPISLSFTHPEFVQDHDYLIACINYLNNDNNIANKYVIKFPFFKYSKPCSS